MIIFAILVVGGLFYLAFTRPRPVSHPPSPITEVGAGAFPEQFPLDIPIEQGAQLAKNFSVKLVDGRVQATRGFLSKASVASNFTFYKMYLTDPGHGWTILGTAGDQDPSHKALFAKNANGVLTVNISRGVVPGTSFVDLSFVTARPVK